MNILFNYSCFKIVTIPFISPVKRKCGHMDQELINMSLIFLLDNRHGLRNQASRRLERQCGCCSTFSNTQPDEQFQRIQKVTSSPLRCLAESRKSNKIDLTRSNKDFSEHSPQLLLHRICMYFIGYL